MKRIVILILALAISMCILAGCTTGKFPENFVNPGDYLGGGGTGEVADGADDVTGEVKSGFTDKDFPNSRQILLPMAQPRSILRAKYIRFPRTGLTVSAVATVRLLSAQRT